MAQTHLTASGISQTFGRRTVLKNASFTAGAGECIGIVGINGGGKSTLLSILAGTRKPSGGTLEICGHPMFQERRLFSELTAYLPQDNPLLEDLTVQDNLRLWFGRKVQEDMPILRQMQLTELLPRRVKNLSGGMKRRLAMACASWAGQPVLIMDEPSSSLDLHQKSIIRDFIRDYTEKGNIVILSTHDMQEIRLCSALYYLEEGVTVPVTYEEAIERLQEGIE